MNDVPENKIKEVKLEIFPGAVSGLVPYLAASCASTLQITDFIVGAGGITPFNRRYKILLSSDNFWAYYIAIATIPIFKRKRHDSGAFR